MSTDIQVPHLSVRFTGADGADAASPCWALTPSGCRDTSHNLAATRDHFSPPEKHGPPSFGCGGGSSEILSHDELVALPYLSLSASPQ